MARRFFLMPCFYCGMVGTEAAPNGLDRVDSSGTYVIENVVSCCTMCNRLKSDFPLNKFINHVMQIAQRLRATTFGTWHEV